MNPRLWKQQGEHRRRIRGTKTSCVWSGLYRSQDNLEVDFIAYGYGWYKPETRLESEESDEVIEEVKILSVKNADADITSAITETARKELQDEIEAAIEGGCYEAEYQDERE